MKKVPRFFCLFLIQFVLFLFYSTVSAFATTYYLSPPSPQGIGSDSADGKSASAPWATLSYASTKLQQGDTLYCMDGTYYNSTQYNQTINWDETSLSAPSNITIKAYTGANPIFDGQGINNGLNGFILIEVPISITIDGLTIRNYDSHTDTGDGIIEFCNGVHDSTIQNCWLYHNGMTVDDQQIYLGGTKGTRNSNIIIRNNIIDASVGYNGTGTPGACIHMWHSSFNNYPYSTTPGNVNGCNIYNNILIGGHYAIIAGNDANNINVFNNTIVMKQSSDHAALEWTDGEGAHVSCQSESNECSGPFGVRNVVVENNVIHGYNYSDWGIYVTSGTSSTGIQWDNTKQVTTNYNDWWKTWSSGWYWGGTSYTWSQYTDPNGSIRMDSQGKNSDPTFEDFSSGNYHLQSTSPCINAGVTISLVQNDKDSLPRPQGSAYCIGAYEYPASSHYDANPILYFDATSPIIYYDH